jgi:2,5-diketo-D-gluconate reductase A
MITKNDLFPIGIGTWGVGGFAEKDQTLDKNKQVDAIAYMFQKGMNYVEANLWYSQGYSAEILAEAFRKSGKNREEIFIVQAVYLKDNKLQDTEAEIDRLLKIFDTDYIDTLQYTQSAFLDYEFDEVCSMADKVVTAGKSRYTSITNENLELLKKYHQRFGDKLFSHEVCFNFEVRANEAEGTIEYAQNNGIVTAIYQPLRRNRTANRNWPILVELSKKYGITQNQVVLSWIISKGLLPLTKSENKAHIDEHLAAIGHKLDPSDIQKLNDFIPPGYKTLPIDWDKTGQGFRIDQVSNVFDEEYAKQISG